MSKEKVPSYARKDNKPIFTPISWKYIFKEFRNIQQRFTLRLQLVAVVTFEILICFALALGIDFILSWIHGGYWNLPSIFEIIILGVFVGAFATYFLSKWLIDPIQTLGTAMESIADGDFSVRLNTKSASKEIKEIYSGFNMMAEELESIEIVQSDFISNVSHEFKTPIAAIEGYSMLLQDDENLTEQQKEYIEKIIFNTHRLSSLTGSVLLLSKLENQSIVSNRTQFNLAEQIRKSVLGLEAQWEKKDIYFDIDIDECDYVGNESLMHHIWDNLLSNAIKFSPPSGDISIRLDKKYDRIVFTISDQGPGISDDAEKHIFDKFYQADSSHKQKGNGLGLALVKKIVDLENGEISVKNNENKGCTFTVTLFQ